MLGVTPHPRLHSQKIPNTEIILNDSHSQDHCNNTALHVQVLSCSGQNEGAVTPGLSPQPLADMTTQASHPDLRDKLHALLDATKTPTARDALLLILRYAGIYCFQLQVGVVFVVQY